MKKLFSLSSAWKLLFCSPHGKTCVYSQSISFFFAHHSGFNSFFHSVSSVFSYRQCFSLLQRPIPEKKLRTFSRNKWSLGRKSSVFLSNLGTFCSPIKKSVGIAVRRFRGSPSSAARFHNMLWEVAYDQPWITILLSWKNRLIGVKAAIFSWWAAIYSRQCLDVSHLMLNFARDSDSLETRCVSFAAVFRHQWVQVRVRSASLRRAV